MLVSRDVVVQAWQLRDFAASGHQFAKTIDSIDRQVVEYLIKDTFRLARAATPILGKAQEDRARSRSASLDPFEPQQTWPLDWAVDRSLVRQVVKAFQAATADVRELFKPVEQLS